MNTTTEHINCWMMAGALGSGVSAILHLAVIAFGAPWYRFAGAGETMVQMVEAGRTLPHFITLMISLVLFGWAAYAMAGAGWTLPLPGARWVLLLITTIYLVRGIGGFFINAQASGRSQAFWLWSSSVCLLIGTVHAVGLRQVWQRL